MENGTSERIVRPAETTVKGSQIMERPLRGLSVGPSSIAALFLISGVLIPSSGAQAAQAEQGQETFQQLCAMCHTVGGGRLVGPDLQSVGERRSEEWIIGFVQHSQQVIQSGDADAVALFEEFGGMMMPDQPLTDDQIRAVIAYIGSVEAGGGADPSVSTPAPQAATEEQVTQGQNLFQGTTRLANGGPTCNSCHDVTNDAVIGGGILALELTTAFSKLGGAGVRAILGSPPFPVMQRAYLDKPLTDEEVASLVAFLERADAEQALHQPRDYGIKLFGSGLLGAVLLLGFYSLAWRGRRPRSVNQKIFDRQVKST